MKFNFFLFPVQAETLKYGTPEGERNIVPQARTNWNLTPWYSPSGNFIQLQSVQEPLSCGATKKFKILYTFQADSQYEFMYQVIGILPYNIMKIYLFYN